MSAPSHTPAPWRALIRPARGAKPERVFVLAERNGNIIVADVGALRSGEARANGDLISAAPDLLLEHERDLIQTELIEAWLIRAGYPPSNPAMAAVGEMVKAKRAVIAKARGGK